MAYLEEHSKGGSNICSRHILTQAYLIHTSRPNTQVETQLAFEIHAALNFVMQIFNSSAHRKMCTKTFIPFYADFRPQKK